VTRYLGVGLTVAEPPEVMVEVAPRTLDPARHDQRHSYYQRLQEGLMTHHQSIVGCIMCVALLCSCNKQPARPPYIVKPDNRPFEEILKGSNYLDTDSGARSDMFESNCSQKPVTLELVDLDTQRHPLTYSEAMQTLDNRGFRPAKVCELAPFAIQYPEVVCQQHIQILAIGSMWTPGRETVDNVSYGMYMNDKFFPQISCSPLESCKLGLDSVGIYPFASGGIRFAAVRK
jgi:hypothetical protein